MRTLRVQAGGAAAVEHAVEPPLPSDRVAIAVSYCGLCGTDVHLDHGARPAPAGTALGHEFVGRVARVGSEVRGWAVDNRVAVLPWEFCGACPRCRAGSEQFCERGGCFAPIKPRGLTDVAHLLPSALFRVPDELPDRAAALTEPVAVAVHAVRRAAVPAGGSAVVTGGGPVGILTACVLRAAEIPVVVVEPDPGRAALIRRAGFTAIAPGEDPGEPAPTTVFECSGRPSAFTAALAAVRPGGTVVVLGEGDDPLVVSAIALIAKEVDVRASLAYSPADFAEALRLLADGRVPADVVITSEVALEQAPDVLRSLSAGGSPELKVLVALQAQGLNAGRSRSAATPPRR